MFFFITISYYFVNLLCNNGTEHCLVFKGVQHCTFVGKTVLKIKKTSQLRKSVIKSDLFVSDVSS